ncbi:EKC/KEOPS complex subunit [Penicillium macrosclerotiorum]|uniref:EKC/KEOPS complex subunit n=1 Tax=Penicillium macrosclerotiorum TaxID=303699 RepID=UPI00254803E9|nr:EKC/KEOPS complex subunit [Penicillium macrosclerotiorum]KAJ5698896.1 EKC/KEOPS complex subunit [Penicillium macrosclerotiorum]
MAVKLETISLPHLPASLPVHVALYRNVQNGAFLRQQLLAGNAEFEYALIDASIVLSRAHALAAIFRAVNDSMNNRLKSHNVHSEIVFSFNPTNNIAESFRKIGIIDSTKDLLVIKVSVTPEITHDSVAAHLESFVQGTPVPFDDQTLLEISDISKIKKLYKLGALPSPTTNADPSHSNGVYVDDAKRRLELSILGAIALRGS